MPSSRGSSPPRDQTHTSYIYLLRQVDSLPLAPHGKPYSSGTVSKMKITQEPPKQKELFNLPSTGFLEYSLKTTAIGQVQILVFCVG